ncbi:hypothetical protein BaRGS_00034052 [Batillaria attramentaria]|uniref:Uncharacterized protein n=1 Tax=Batillaria attramentaria TaxID=370345 RepID=A0ABD0JIB9_9CAEN
MPLYYCPNASTAAQSSFPLFSRESRRSLSPLSVQLGSTTAGPAAKWWLARNHGFYRVFATAVPALCQTKRVRIANENCVHKPWQRKYYCERMAAEKEHSA